LETAPVGVTFLATREWLSWLHIRPKGAAAIATAGDIRLEIAPLKLEMASGRVAAILLRRVVVNHLHTHYFGQPGGP